MAAFWPSPQPWSSQTYSSTCSSGGMVWTGHHANQAYATAAAATTSAPIPRIHFMNRRIALLPARTVAYSNKLPGDRMAIVYGLRDVANISTLRKLLAFTVVSLAPALLAASPGVTLPADQSVQVESLSTEIELLEDPTGTLDVEAVSRPPASSGFVAGSPEKANVGFSRSAWWVRLTVRNQGTEARDLYLRQGYPLIDLLDFYQPQDLAKDGGWHHVATGDRRPFDARPVAHRDFLFPMTLPPDSHTTIYLRYSSQGPVDINLSLLEPNKLAETLSREQLAY